jgi:hypothetical protein
VDILPLKDFKEGAATTIISKIPLPKLRLSTRIQRHAQITKTLALYLKPVFHGEKLNY